MSAARAGLDGVACAVVVGLGRVVAGAGADGFRIGVDVAVGREVVVVGRVGHRARVAVHVCPVAAGVSAYVGGGVVDVVVE